MIFAGILIDRHLLDIRTPFIDSDLVDFILSVPESLRYNYYLYRKMLIRFFPDLVEVPWHWTELKITVTGLQEKILGTSIRAMRRGEKTLNRLGFPIQMLTPKWFLDFDKIFRENRKTREFVLDTIQDPRTFNRPFFSRKGLENLMKDHMAKKRNHAEEIARVLTLELFMREFVDG